MTPNDAWKDISETVRERLFRYCDTCDELFDKDLISCPICKKDFLQIKEDKVG